MKQAPPFTHVMRFTVRAILVSVTTFFFLLTTQAQQAANDIGLLQNDIARLTAIERNPEFPDELRNLNRTILDDRKSRLHQLLEQKLTALREYRRVVSLSASESTALDDVIKNVEKQWRATYAESSNDSAPSNTGVFVSPQPASKNKGKGKPDVQTIRVDTIVKKALDPHIKSIDSDNPAFDFDGEVGKLINIHLPELDRQSTSIPPKDLYCVVHIVEWAASKVKQDAWFLYRSPKPDANHVSTASAWERQENFDGKRIYGSEEVGVLFLHADAPYPSGADISYKISVQKKTPAPVSDVLTLLGNITSVKAAGTKGDLYAASLIKVENLPSDMVITASLAVEDQQTQVLTRTYDNEGRYHWDVSVGVPVKTIREVQFVSDGNTVTTSAKDKQDVYGFLNIYPWAVDVKDEKALTPPHFLVGVPLASKPLHHPLLGVGFGVYKAPVKFNVFAGVVFNRELVPRTLTTGSNATPSELESDLHPRWVRKFTWGINFPISQIKSALK